MPETAASGRAARQGSQHVEQAGAAALGQSWVLGSDKTVRVGAHSEYCLDIDGAKTVVGTPLITYRCNNISINGVHNQQFEYDQSNRTLRSAIPCAPPHVCKGSFAEFYGLAHVVTRECWGHVARGNS